MKKISEHISYEEATRTNVNLPNVPNDGQLECMVAVANKIFEPTRKALGDKPIRINSFFRDYEVNVAIGGSKTSQHCRGMAIDMDTESRNSEMFFYIKDSLDFDQLIWENGDENNPNWVHVSYNGAEPNRNRKQVLVLRGGKYLPYDDSLCKRPVVKKETKAKTTKKK